jgi:hypothetical protein
MARWHLSGDYFKSCNCDVASLCVFLSDPVQGHCDVGIAWHIEHGAFNGTALDGLNVAGTFHAPGTSVRPKTWTAALYLDARAERDQADALGQIFSGAAGGHFGATASLIATVEGVRAVPIEFTAEGPKRWVKAGDVLEMAVEAIPAADPAQEVQVADTPQGVAPGFAYVVARSAKNVFQDYGLSWDHSGKSGFYSRFAYIG